MTDSIDTALQVASLIDKAAALALIVTLAALIASLRLQWCRWLMHLRHSRKQRNPKR